MKCEKHCVYKVQKGVGAARPQLVKQDVVGLFNPLLIVNFKGAFPAADWLNEAIFLQRCCAHLRKMGTSHQMNCRHAHIMVPLGAEGISAPTYHQQRINEAQDEARMMKDELRGQAYASSLSSWTEEDESPSTKGEIKWTLVDLWKEDLQKVQTEVEVVHQKVQDLEVRVASRQKTTSHRQ
ncbi:Hypothetical predicted protein [Pelobates cultripes]|uniref:Uncharacterized protein n=1 Tax=Pelobates cultripes TaxID=61616 RepID=A0AAD1R846_PELCU|nr:Hypothetical predicted protein [Pelobates cultripes]